MIAENDTTAAIKRTLERFAEGWREEDGHLLLSLWDQTYPECSYIASESEEPIKGVEAIAGYYRDALDAFGITHMTIDDVWVDVSEGGQLAYAFCNIDIGFTNGEWEKTVYPRATFTLRKQEDQWKFIHYHESIQYDVPD